MLVKFLFPKEKLSVQVHPDDADARALGGAARAKTECWYVLEASDGAALSLGVKPGTTEAEVRSVLGKPEFESLLQPVPVKAGDMVYVEAGTVHAIGEGMVLLETQQTSETTYRLYDYGRPRELHLDDGMKVIKLQTAAGIIPPRELESGTRLIEVKHFVVDRFDVPVGGSVFPDTANGPQCLIGLCGEGSVVTGEDRVELYAGQAVIVPASQSNYKVEGNCSFVRCISPSKSSEISSI